jgi:hypothetical protein
MSRICDNTFAKQLIRDSGMHKRQREWAFLALFFSVCLIGLSTLTPHASGQVSSALYYSMGGISLPFAWRMFDSLAGFVTTLMLVVLIPPVAAVSTAICVSRYAGTANLQELRMTPLGERAIVQAYMWAALFKMPVVVTLTTGLCASLLVRVPFYIPLFPYDELSQLLFALLRVIAVVDILVRLWLAVTVGVALALWVRLSPFLAGLCSMGMTLTLTLAIMALQSVLRANLQFPFARMLAPLSNYNVKGILVFDILNGLVWASVAAGLAVISTYWAKRGISIERIVG